MEGKEEGSTERKRFGRRKTEVVKEMWREKREETVVKRRCVTPFSRGNFEEFSPVEVLGDFGFLCSGSCGGSCGGSGGSSVCVICGNAWDAECAWVACFSVVGGRSGC